MMNFRIVVTLSALVMAAGQGYGPDPEGVPADFLCGWRSLAYNYSVALRPDSAQAVYDALQHWKYCTGADAIPRPGPSKVFPPKTPVPNAAGAIYVDTAKGSDQSSGTEADPMKTIQAALQKTPKTVVLREGTFYVPAAVEITAANQGVTIQNYPGEAAWISGGVELQGLAWVQDAPGIFKTNVRGAYPSLKSISSLRFNGDRMWQARYPNANPETTAWPVGYLTSSKAQWLPPKIAPQPNPATIVSVATPNRDWDAYFQNYSGGVGGTCSIYDPPFSFWCQSSFPEGCGGCFTWNIPSGLNTTDLPSYPSLLKPNGTKAYMNAWRAAHWANWKFEIDSVEQGKESVMKFGKGGFQGARGGPGSDWYISNVHEALDTPGEYFFDEADGYLYIYSNTSSAPLPSDLIVASQEHTVLSITSVKNVTISGIGFRDTSPTMMEPHGVPSGGDWALERIGAVFIENTESTAVSNCLFTRIGGNGIMISKANLYTKINKNEFEWMGGSAVAAWGWTDEITDNGVHGYDGTKGDFPRHTVVEENLFHEIGVWEKQSSAFFQAKTAQSVVKRNVVFNLARAGFNFNDGFGGGDDVAENVLFNTCRESSDHGPINSWDRQPYMTTVRTGQPSFQMEWRNIHNNIVIANYGGVKEVDNDDGSLFYNIHTNFMAYGWSQKFKCGGIVSHDNIKAFVSTGGYFNAGCTLTASHFYPNSWYQDTMVKLEPENFQYRDCWGSSGGHDWDQTQVHNNTIYLHPSTDAYVVCNKTNVPLRQFQDGTGNDPGSVQINNIPSTKSILGWARNTLGKW